MGRGGIRCISADRSCTRGFWAFSIPRQALTWNSRAIDRSISGKRLKRWRGKGACDRESVPFPAGTASAALFLNSTERQVPVYASSESILRYFSFFREVGP